MRKLLAPALLLLAVGVGVAWYALAASLRAEREYTALIHRLAGEGSARVLDSRFERGWLRSRADSSIEVSGAAGAAFRAFVTSLGATDVRERVGIHMVHEIEHGPLPLLDWVRGGFEGAPILARIASTIEIDHEAQLELAEAIGKVPAVEARTTLRTGGEASTELDVPAQRLRATGEGFAREAHFEGASGALDFRDGYRHVIGTLASAGFAGRGLERAVELRDVVWRFDVPGSALPVGRAELEIGSLRVTPGADDGGLALEAVTVAPEGRLAGGRFEATVALRAQAASLGGHALGPASLDLALLGLDAPALRRLQHAGLRLQEAGGAAADPVATAVAAGALAEALPVLLDGAPRAELRALRLTTSAGPVAARGHLALTRPALGGALSPGSFLEGTLEAEAAAPAADAALAALLSPARAAELRARGALVVENGQARLRAEWRRGTLALNGVALPAPAPAPAAATAAAPAPAPADPQAPASAPDPEAEPARQAPSGATAAAAAAEPAKAADPSAAPAGGTEAAPAAVPAAPAPAP